MEKIRLDAEVETGSKGEGEEGKQLKGEVRLI